MGNTGRKWSRKAYKIMITIHKYPIPVKEKFSLQLPACAEIIRCEDVDGFFFIWAKVDTEAPMEERYFEMHKTGSPMSFAPNQHAKYLGACKLLIVMELCLYVFEVIDVNPVFE